MLLADTLIPSHPIIGYYLIAIK